MGHCALSAQMDGLDIIWIRSSMASFIFFYFAGVILLTATLVVVLRNPIYSALSLLVMFFHVAGLYVTLHAEFLAAVQIIVYAGAILVLYLFVVMLLNVKREERLHGQASVALFLGVTLLTEAVFLVLQSEGPMFPATASIDSGGSVAGNTKSIGQVLFSTYLFPFEVASLILLVAMVGAVILSKKGILDPKP